jgi:hypothetical protein
VNIAPSILATITIIIIDPDLNICPVGVVSVKPHSVSLAAMFVNL